MSNATSDTRGAGGERRRRRSRGGKGRNRNRHHDNQNENRQQQGGRQRQDRGPRPPRREHKPAPLTWWQKLLKLIGLYKEPAPPPRQPREERKPRLNIEEAPVKSNTRIAKSADGGQRRNAERTEVGSPRIYLGNLSYDTTEEDLKDLFKGVGSVRRVEIIYNRRTHKSKGYGFVDMLNTDEAKRSVEVLHDQPFMGRKLVVSGAKLKEYDDAQREEAVEEARPAPAAAAVADVTAVETVIPLVVETAPETAAETEETPREPNA